MIGPIKMGQRHRIIWVLVLAVAAYLTNLAPLPLSFGLHFLFGGLFAMLAAILFGPWAGAFVALASAIPTLNLWGHPYAMLSMTLEAWVVGQAARRGRMLHTETDLVYWLLLGGPLVLVTYSMGANIPLMATGVAALKQAVNGLVNTSIASLLVLGLLVRRRDRRRQFSLEIFLSILITFLVLAPIAFALNWTARESGEQVRSQLSGEAVRAGSVVRLSLERELGDQRRALMALAGQATSERPSVELPSGIRAAWFLDAAGQVLYHLPADGPAVPPAEPLGRLVTSESYGSTVLMDQAVSGLTQGNAVRVVAALDVERMSRRVMEGVLPLEMEVLVADSANQVLFASSEALSREATLLQDLGQVAFFSRSDATSLAQAERQVFVHRTAEPQLGWQVFVRKPLGVVEYLLYRSYLRSYLIALGLIMLVLVSIRFVAYTVTRPLVALAAITVTPEGDLSNLPQEQPVWVAEVWEATAHLEEVGGRVRGLVQSLRETQRELEQHNVELAVANLHLADEALRDAETGLLNQRAFQHQVQLWVEENRPFTLLLADWQGPVVRDETRTHRRSEERLKQVAQELQQSTAFHGGEAYRHGGNRFALLFPEANPWLIERMSRVLTDGAAFLIGGALFPEEGQTAQAVLSVADQRLSEGRA